ncbi:MAG TPA: DUF2254 domain-containing protein, partial [Acidimicrobiia bacterium]
TVAGATITVAAIVFSITALSTQMASSQYSPRSVGGFFEDPFQQTIIGLVIGTFTYSLMVLASLGSAIADGSEATTSISVTISLILGVISVIGIVGYINHSLRRMQIDSVVRRIANASISAIHRHLERADDEEATADGSPTHGDSRSLKTGTGGWVVMIDEAHALEALPPGSTARIDVRLGEAVAPGDRIIVVWPDPGEDWEGAPALLRSVVTAQERSLDLDPTFGIRQLVDIGLRALSPGINDPSTAVDVVHHLKTPVRTVLLSDAPRRVFSGPENRRVFLSRTPGRSEYVYQAFSEIRLIAGRQPYVLSALLEVLGDLKADLEEADLSERVGAVDHELRATIETAQSSGLPEDDLKRVLERAAVSHYLDESENSG